MRHNMPDLRVFDIFGERSGTRNPPLHFWGCIIQKRFLLVFLGTKPSFMAFSCIQAGTLVCSTPLQYHPRADKNTPKKDGMEGYCMVWEKPRVGGTPPSLFWGQRVQGKGEVLAQIIYRQVRWCAALFCSTSPEQAKIAQNMSNFRVCDIFGQHSVKRTPLTYFEAVEGKTNRSVPAKNLLLLKL